MTPRPILLFSGKGGVGKSTLSAAAALLLARRGEPTLLVSTDHAHSTGDLLGRPLSGGPLLVEPGLWALELDPEAAADAHVEGVRATVRGSVDPDLLPAVERHLALARGSPGTVEAALLDRMGALMADCPDPYGRLVLDTAPSGHTLRLLALPELLTAWIDGLVRQREKVTGMERMLGNLVGQEDDRGRGDPMVIRLRERRARLQEVGRRLREDAAIWLVCTPQRLAIEETARTARTLEDGGLQIAGVVVNQVLPDDADGAFLAQRGEQEAANRAELARRFAGRHLVTVLQQPSEVTSRDQLLAIASQLEAAGVA